MNSGTVSHAKRAAPRKRAPRTAEAPKTSSPTESAAAATLEAPDAAALAPVVAAPTAVEVAQPLATLPALWTQQAEAYADLAYDMQARFIKNSLSFVEQVSPRSARMIREWTDLLGWTD